VDRSVGRGLDDYYIYCIATLVYIYCIATLVELSPNPDVTTDELFGRWFQET
jgi:hypothetical protein